MWGLYVAITRELECINQAGGQPDDSKPEIPKWEEGREPSPGTGASFDFRDIQPIELRGEGVIDAA
jgi:hypothetical protein